MQDSHANLAPIPLHTPTQDELEPGLIAIYRTFTALHLLISVTGMLLSMLPENDDIPNDSRTLFTIIWQIVLLAYLVWPRLAERVGRLYLPIALVFGSLMPLIGRFLLMNPALMPNTPNVYSLTSTISSGQLFLALLIPLLLIGWQYSFAIVLLYSLTTTLIEHLLLYGGYGTPPLSMETAGITVSRTIIFLFTGYVLTRLMSAQRAQRRKLAEANHQLMHYAATAERLAVSRERNRLARELHDTLAHTLSGLSVQLEAVDSAWEYAPDQARGILHKALAGTRNGLTETRRALQALRASPLEDLGLARALQALAESCTARAGMQLEMSLPDEVKNIAPDVEQTVYRIAQETLSNAVKHSGAQTIRLALTGENGTLILEIADDGRGFQADEKDQLGHYGLAGMQERAELIGGTLQIDSKPGSGTRVRLEVSQL